MSLLDIQTQCLENSERWFPDTAHNLGYSLIALMGELGEFANLFKKVERGSLELTKEVHVELCFELTDVFIYLANMAAIMNFDLEEAYKVKQQYNEERFGAGSPNHPDEHVGSDSTDEVSDGASSFVSISDVSKPLQGRQ